MKRISNVILSKKIKEEIALYTQEFIKANFESHTADSIDLLQKNIAFFNNPSLGETILKQTLLKGSFPNSSYRKNIILKEMDSQISPKIIIAQGDEKADYNFIGEIKTASMFANSSPSILSIIMNSEVPRLTTTIIDKISGNTIRDLTINFKVGQSIFSQELDIKAGNNATRPFSNVLSSVPYTEEINTYQVINNKSVDLNIIQEMRLSTFRSLANHTNDARMHELVKSIEVINNMPLDIIKKNILIQEQLFTSLSQQLFQDRPSFYVAYVVSSTSHLHRAFYEHLEPFINTNIFNSKQDFKLFLSQGIIAYNKNRT